ncbi:MAG TPA: phosphate acyltransferase PlsX [Bacillota bacterium]|jgi:glycerol-3-phosphate acyltransferase PlsX
MTRVAVDAMGGDKAPSEIVKGALAAATARDDLEIILVGRPEDIDLELAAAGGRARVSQVPASEVIGTDEPPVQAIRRKKDSSINVGTRLIKEGRADAFVSAGSTGAFMASALLTVGRIKGVERPALATVVNTIDGRGTVLLDVGANVDCSPSNLLTYALMGSIYAERVLGREKPGVGLINVGLEENKGSILTKEAFALLKEAPINFVGNVEAREILNGRVDVIVCDGFVGNAIIKTAEGIVQGLLGMIKEEITRGGVRKLAAAALKPAFARVKKRLDYAEYGGAPFLGVSGAFIKCHGSSGARAIENGVRVAAEFARTGALAEMERAMASWGRSADA